MEINNPTLVLFLILIDPVLPFHWGRRSRVTASHPTTRNPWRGGLLPQSLEVPDPPSRPSSLFSWRLFQAQASGLRRKHLGMSFESLPILQGARGELINAGLAQQVGEGASAWVGGPGPTPGCAQRGRRVIWRPQLGGPGWGKVICSGLRGGLLRCPRQWPAGPGEILISHLLRSHPHPTEHYRTLPLPILFALSSLAACQGPDLWKRSGGRRRAASRVLAASGRSGGGVSTGLLRRVFPPPRRKLAVAVPPPHPPPRRVLEAPRALGAPAWDSGHPGASGAGGGGGRVAYCGVLGAQVPAPADPEGKLGADRAGASLPTFGSPKKGKSDPKRGGDGARGPHQAPRPGGRVAGQDGAEGSHQPS